MRQLQGFCGAARRRAARLHRAEPAHRIRDAQHARAGRPVARRQHQPERRLHGVLHRRGGAGGRQGPARVPPRADEEHPKHLAVLNAAAEKGDWGKPLPAGRASRHRAVHGLRQLLGRDRRGLGEPAGQAQGASHGAGARTAATRSIPTRSRRRSKARSPTASPPTLYGEMHGREGPHARAQLRQLPSSCGSPRCPKVETVIVPTYDFWGGVGEPTICVVAPAVLNAILRRDRQAGAQPAAEEREASLIERAD